MKISITKTFATVTKKIYSPSRQSVFLTCRVTDPFLFTEGQFCSLTIPGMCRANGKPLQNPYSIASAYTAMQEQKEISFGIKETGTDGMADYLVHTIQLGDTIHIAGPLGHMTYQGESHSILIATGSGLGPIWSLYQAALQKQSTHITFLYGEKTESDVYDFVKEEFVLPHTEKVHRFLCYSRQDPSTHNTTKNNENIFFGRVSHAFAQLPHTHTTNTHIYLCGTPVMTQEMTELCMQYGYKKENIHQESR